MSKAPRLALALALGTSLFAWEKAPVLADPSPIVAKVGARTISAADLERRMAVVPPFQLRTFGDTPDEIRKNFLTRVLVREALLSQGADERKLPSRTEVREKIRGVMRNAMLTKLRNEVQEKDKPTDADVKAYYDAHAAKYKSPARVALWQIVVGSREDALAILADLKKDPTPKRWNQIARDKSLDKLTNMRGGNLGFVHPDGTTSEPGVRVSPELVKAAEAVKDTEIVPDPVKDGDRWVVVWRRQSMRAIERPLELEAGSIRQILLHERTSAKIKEFVAGLRKDGVRDHHPELLELIDLASSGELSPVRRPGALPAGRRQASPAPSSGGR
jgi:peptidyl-prolyl cis-trans isomerase C